MATEKSSKRLQLTAYHEAGHAVAGYHLTPENYSKGASIIRDGRTLGRVTEENSPLMSIELVENEIVKFYSGFAAELQYNPTAKQDAKVGASDDDEKARDLLDKLDLTTKEREELDNTLRQRAIEFVTAHWNEIDAVAKELLEMHILDDDEVCLIIEAASGNTEAKQALKDYRQMERHPGHGRKEVMKETGRLLALTKALAEKAKEGPISIEEFNKIVEQSGVDLDKYLSDEDT